MVDRNAERLLSVVNDLLLAAQIQSGTMPLDFGDLLLNDLVEQAGEAAKPLATSRKIGLKIIVEPDLALTGDASRLGQVLDNLISNALKYTLEGGTVTLTATRVGENVVVEVADTGIGIPKAEQEQMFGRFFRTSNARLAAIPGTGLGLVVTRGMSRAMAERLASRAPKASGRRSELCFRSRRVTGCSSSRKACRMKRCVSAERAEGEGFEPSSDPKPETVFETAAFDRSATPPRERGWYREA